MDTSPNEAWKMLLESVWTGRTAVQLSRNLWNKIWEIISYMPEQLREKGALTTIAEEKFPK